MLKRLQYKVQDVTMLSDSICSVELEPLQEKATYKPGQYCEVLCADGKKRFFSIVSIPTFEKNIRIHIRLSDKNTSNFSNITTLHTIVEIRGGFGCMYKALRSGKNRILFAEGMGIVPFCPILDILSKNGDKSQISLIWTRRELDDKYARSDIGRWKKNLENFKSYNFKDKEEDISESIIRCKNIIKKTENVIVAFGGSPKTFRYIKEKLDVERKEKNIEYISDV